ncbi:MAG: peptidase [Bdellovibrionales bacterium RIFOXYD12_FULL_39_22]|nr:MAG: peptidase [Bdellovibrionales bacterium RIFOXYB1_FULL_39_21]OFZ40839.1 MAG: peptidase [Bdellovibrionales bacterium RIFOXYC12_FULL_39_17]OFZ44380.1 MAG: peptidase [Bdellovibrionales bacterium RIFOXYC1_FULL_39_130]OFZ74127.1 MAG: peptidase [Bdellovibrionales bacterium RIFOXYD1_FULL_39_84]OFZ91976.1 MAG: peptidase [Bdellovibrionales bacterium RIFOXYD12_FULL_39_22]HLE12293.1 TldD/PmbA family protein [Bacteriovoracaceae bacterium]
MRYDISQFARHFNLYTELRFQENRVTSISCNDGTITTNTKSANSGVSARVGYKGRSGFSSSSVWADDTVAVIIKEAESHALFLGSKANVPEYNYFPKEFKIEKSFATTKRRYSQQEIVELVRDLDNYIVRNFPNLKGRSVMLVTLDMEKVLLTSTKSYAHTLTPRTVVSIVLRAEGKDGMISVGDRMGGLGQVEDVLDNPQTFYSKIDKLHQQLLDKKEAVYAKAGFADVILNADLAGILAHEAIGHTTEADLVMAGSVAGDYLNKKVASELVTLVDFAHEAFGEILPIPVYVDDEGVIASDTTIIEKGVLKNFMHNKESANHFGVAPTGNARAFSFSDEPLIRMRNTVILPGNDKLSEMIASIENGYYLMKRSNGQADATSEFMFGVPVGYEIKNGKIGRAIKDTTISGVAFDVLKTVTMVSDDFSCAGVSFCGKKQMMPTGMGGPAIKCKLNIGGK